LDDSITNDPVPLTPYNNLEVLLIYTTVQMNTFIQQGHFKLIKFYNISYCFLTVFLGDCKRLMSVSKILPQAFERYGLFPICPNLKSHSGLIIFCYIYINAQHSMRFTYGRGNLLN